MAVAPGTVVEVVRDLPDATPEKNPEGLTIVQIAGNPVIIDMGSAHHAMSAHLAPGSIQLHVGDYVRQGQKLDLQGTRSTPARRSLHFQAMARPSSLDGTSLTFVFDHMNLDGRVPLNLTALDGKT